jgi:hypothetical protein
MTLDNVLAIAPSAIAASRADRAWRHDEMRDGVHDDATVLLVDGVFGWVTRSDGVIVGLPPDVRSVVTSDA